MLIQNDEQKKALANHPGTQKMQAARMVAVMAYPEYRHGLMSVTLVCEPACGTAAADRHGRVYFNPYFIDQMEVEHAAFIWVHELSHILWRHCQRSKEIGADQTQELADVANYAMDARIHEDMFLDRRLPPPPQDVIKLCTLTNLNLPRGGAWEEDFVTLLGRRQQGLMFNGQPFGAPGYSDTLERGSDGTEGTEGDKGENGTGAGAAAEEGGNESGNVMGPLRPTSGSGSSGRGRKWEQGDATTESGMSEAELEEMRKQIARDIEERQRSRGNVGANMLRWADTTLRKRINPMSVLRQLLTQMCGEIVSGNAEATYSRLNRRSEAFQDDFVRPGNRSHLPKLEIVFDTSGSMTDEDISIGATAIEPVLKSFRRLQVTSGDVRTCASEAITVVKRKLQLGGGGGTDMARILEEIRERKSTDRPDIVLLVTDGYTPWPEKKIKEFRVIVILMDRGADVPKWAKVIDGWRLKEAKR